MQLFFFCFPHVDDIDPEFLIHPWKMGGWIMHICSCSSCIKRSYNARFHGGWSLDRATINIFITIQYCGFMQTIQLAASRNKITEKNVNNMRTAHYSIFFLFFSVIHYSGVTGGGVTFIDYWLLSISMGIGNFLGSLAIENPEHISQIPEILDNSLCGLDHFPNNMYFCSYF